MKKMKTILTLTLLTFGLFCSAQVVDKETIKTDNVNHNITITETGMYDGTMSKKAQEYFDKAADYGNKKDFVNAKKWYLKAIKEDDKYVEAYDNLGLVHRRLGEIDKAIEYYKKSIQIYSKGVMAHQNLAVAYGILEDYKSAIKEYEKILKLSPNNPEGYFGLANSNMMLSDFDSALENAQKALDLYKKINSHHIGDGYQMIGLIYYYKKEDGNAKKYLQKAKDMGVKIHAQLEKDLFGNEAQEERDGIRMETPEDYAELEDLVVLVFDWILKTPLDVEPNKRKEFNAFLLKWISGSPSVSIEISADIVTYTECTDCLLIFMGGWTKYAIEAKDKATKLAGNVAGTEAVIEFYTKNKKIIGKNKAIEKWLKRKQKGKLESYIKSKM